jgi:C-terminal processing protease CtpA/Prc
MESFKRLLAYAGQVLKHELLAVFHFVLTLFIQGFSQTNRQELCSLEPCGVGIELECNSSGQWGIAAVRPGGPADLSTMVRPGDLVVSVEWSPIQVVCSIHRSCLLF